MPHFVANEGSDSFKGHCDEIRKTIRSHVGSSHCSSSEFKPKHLAIVGDFNEHLSKDFGNVVTGERLLSIGRKITRSDGSQYRSDIADSAHWQLRGERQRLFFNLLVDCKLKLTNTVGPNPRWALPTWRTWKSKRRHAEGRQRVQRQEDYIALPASLEVEAGTRPIPIRGGDHYAVLAKVIKGPKEAPSGSVLRSPQPKPNQFANTGWRPDTAADMEAYKL